MVPGNSDLLSACVFLFIVDKRSTYVLMQNFTIGGEIVPDFILCLVLLYERIFVFIKHQQ